MINMAEKVYEQRKNDLTFEIDFIEGIQYNFKLEDIENLLMIKTQEDLIIFKKYLYYLDVFRINYLFTDSYEDTINKFNSILDNDIDKEKIVNLFVKHDNLFCDETGMKKLVNVPKIYNSRIFNGCN